jgi:NAD(P)-dependent dehydrogenase (short-subunit alcohol dehydrogenase family)
VAIVDIDLAAAEAVKAQIEKEGGKATALKGDISEAAQVRAVIEQVVGDGKRLDILVNSAGVGLIRPVAEASEEEFDRLAAIDLRGMWLCSKYAIPHMLYGLYAAMKAGVAGLTRGIAVQYGADGIRANTVSPGLVDGKQSREVIAQITPDVEVWLRNFVRRGQALPRLIEPEDNGRVVVFLASDDARAVTGAEIPVDGGLWAQLLSRD